MTLHVHLVARVKGLRGIAVKASEAYNHLQSFASKTKFFKLSGNIFQAGKHTSNAIFKTKLTLSDSYFTVSGLGR